MKIVIFEDGTHDNFYPLSETRPLCELRCGAFTMRERIETVVRKTFGAYELSYTTRTAIAGVASEQYGINAVNAPLHESDTLFINALYAPFNILPKKNEAFVSSGRIAAIHLDTAMTGNISAGKDSLIKSLEDAANSASIVRTEIPSHDFFPSHIWDMVLSNGRVISSDFALLTRGTPSSAGIQFAHTGSADSLYIEEGVTIDPFVSIDTRKGPVIIRKGCMIHSFTRIEGPSSIGEDTIITGGKIREGCSFGPSCRVGGETEDAIFQGYTNKYHDGFIGHAYAGSWVNFGALSTNSDLRNDYGTVTCAMPSGKIDTGSGKVGCFIGDYTKAGIGSLINTGSVIGTGCMIVHSGRMTPPHIPSFCRFIKNELREEKDINSVIETNCIAASRRNKELTPAMESLLKKIFEDSRKKRITESELWNAALK